MGIQQVLRLEFRKFRILEILNFHPCTSRHELKVVFGKVNCILYLLEVVKQKGLEHITVDDLVAEITPKGRCKLW